MIIFAIHVRKHCGKTKCHVRQLQIHYRYRSVTSRLEILLVSKRILFEKITVFQKGKVLKMKGRNHLQKLM